MIDKLCLQILGSDKGRKTLVCAASTASPGGAETIWSDWSRAVYWVQLHQCASLKALLQLDATVVFLTPVCAGRMRTPFLLLHESVVSWLQWFSLEKSRGQLTGLGSSLPPVIWLTYRGHSFNFGDRSVAAWKWWVEGQQTVWPPDKPRPLQTSQCLVTRSTGRCDAHLHNQMNIVAGKSVSIGALICHALFSTEHLVFYEVIMSEGVEL